MLKHLTGLLGKRVDREPQEVQPPNPYLLKPDEVSLVVPMVKGVNVAADDGSGQVISLSFEQSPASRSFAADMVVMYAIDRPNHLEYVSNAVAGATGLSIDQLHETSIRNLPSRLGEVQLHDCGGGVYGLTAGGNFEASLLLMPELWVQLKEYLPGDIMAAVPSRDLLFVIGSDRPNAAQLIREKAHIELAEKRYAISQSVIVKRENTWVAFAH